MTSIENVPYEVLLNILELSEHSDMYNCQNVCRAWYLPAHALFLKKVVILSGDQAQRFIRCIDRNPSPSYLKAVENMIIKDLPSDEAARHGFNKEKVEKLLFRFPNLTSVHVKGSLTLFENFRGGLCAKFQENCPKLDQLEVYLDDDRNINVYCDIIFKLQPLLTAFSLDKVGNIRQYHIQRFMDFVTSFPRLQVIEHSHFGNITQLLPIFEKLSNIKSLSIEADKYAKMKFFENFLTTKSSQDRLLIIERLSRVAQMDYSALSSSYSSNELQFISNYMTGLKSFKICSPRFDILEDKSTFSTVMDIFLRANDDSCITLHCLLPRYKYSKYLRKIMQTLFCREATTSSQKRKPTKVLRIDVHFHAKYPGRMEWYVRNNRRKFEREIAILYLKMFKYQPKLNKRDFQLYKKDFQDVDVDVFILSVKNNNNTNFTIDIDDFDDDLKEKIPSLKKVIFDLPGLYEERRR